MVEKSATTSEVQENLLCCAATKARNREGSPSLRHIAYIYIRLIIYGEDASTGKQLWFCKASPGETQQSFQSLWPSRLILRASTAERLMTSDHGTPIFTCSPVSIANLVALNGRRFHRNEKSGCQCLFHMDTVRHPESACQGMVWGPVGPSEILTRAPKDLLNLCRFLSTRAWLIKAPNYGRTNYCDNHGAGIR